MRRMSKVVSVLWALVVIMHGSEARADGTSRLDREQHRLDTPMEMVLVDFGSKTNLKGWHIEDDVVMGGRSKGAFFVNDEGHAVFSGTVSLENNGGFSSVQHDFDPVDVSHYSKAVLRVKGDGKRYQFRVESNQRESHSYVYPFETNGEWQTVEISFAEIYAQYRGERLDLPNYPGRTMAHARFFIANGQQEAFRLEIDSVVLK